MCDGPCRKKEEMLAEFTGNIERLYDKFLEKGKTVIFVANIPASPKNEESTDTYWRVLHMDDINKAYKEASARLGFPFISLYDLFSEYCRDNGIDFTTLLADGLHPNDEGYKVMFALLKGALLGE